MAAGRKKPKLDFDRIGYWSEVKLDIVREYAKAYSTILAKQKPKFEHIYIDGFAGAGEHISKKTGLPIPGSPLNALNVAPPFRSYHFVDLEQRKVAHLRGLVGDRPDVEVHEGDCNEVLVQKVLPSIRYDRYRRALCLLDPYGLSLRWEVIATAGKLRTIDLFLNFPIMDMNRNAFWLNPTGVDAADIERMNAFWGDESWRTTVYGSEQRSLFGEHAPMKTATNEAIAGAFRKRLKQIAGFPEVPKPMPMRNSTGAVVYYLFFASQKKVAAKIARDLFEKHGHRSDR